MKKLSIVGIVVVILSIMMCCVSHAQTDTEITFRGVPWGQTFDETAADTSLDDETRTLFYNARRTYDVWEETLFNISNKAGYEEGMPTVVQGNYKCNLYVYKCFELHASITVAGTHKTSLVKLYYMYTPEDELKFYEARYVFSSENRNGFDDFVTKLTSLYGEPDEDLYEYSYTNTSTGESKLVLSMKWTDKNNNTVCISTTLDKGGDGVGDITICYESGQTCKWALERKEYLDAEKASASGL